MYLKFINKKVKIDIEELAHLIICKMDKIASKISIFNHLIISKTDLFYIF